MQTNKQANSPLNQGQGYMLWFFEDDEHTYFLVAEGSVPVNACEYGQFGDDPHQQSRPASVTSRIALRLLCSRQCPDS